MQQIRNIKSISLISIIDMNMLYIKTLKNGNLAFKFTALLHDTNKMHIVIIIISKTLLYIT